MRRLVVLCLIVGVGIAFAGPERWITSPAHCITASDPEPGIFPEAPEVFRPAVDTFYYDNNFPAMGWRWTVAGNGWGVKFTSPSDNITLAGALVHYMSGGTKAMVKVFADDGPGGSPGTELWVSDTLTITTGEWNYVPIDEPIVGTNYYIFHYQPYDSGSSPYFSIDGGNNAPSHRMWTLSGGGFSEYADRGDWLIRACVDWTPQENNAAPQYFSYTMPPDTLPGVLIRVYAMVKNLGSAVLPTGTTVRLHITGPNAYTYDDTMATTVNLEHGGQQQMLFMPMWQVPSLAGLYRINVWTEAAGEDWTADDTITYDLSVARWIEYADFEAGRYWIVSVPNSERATNFDPTDFGLDYPVGISRVRSKFAYSEAQPWPDSSFLFKVYADDGVELLYESDTLEAMHNQVYAYDLDSLLIVDTGTFWVSVKPIHGGTGRPSGGADMETDSASYYGTPGNWTPLWWQIAAEWMTSASVIGGVGLEEPDRLPVYEPALFTGYPNPAVDRAMISWQVPGRQKVSVDLYDATGSLVQNLFSSQASTGGSVALDSRRLPAGIYLVRLETEDATATRKLVLKH
jgi:hypothetical protein